MSRFMYKLSKQPNNESYIHLLTTYKYISLRLQTLYTPLDKKELGGLMHDSEEVGSDVVATAISDSSEGSVWCTFEKKTKLYSKYAFKFYCMMRVAAL